MLATVLAALTPIAIKGVILGVEKIFGPGQGSTKKQAAISALASMAGPLIQSGKLKDADVAAALEPLVEAFVGSMNATGELPQPATTTAPAGSLGMAGRKVTLVFQNGVLVDVA